MAKKVNKKTPPAVINEQSDSLLRIVQARIVLDTDKAKESSSRVVAIRDAEESTRSK